MINAPLTLASLRPVAPLAIGCVAAPVWAPAPDGYGVPRTVRLALPGPASVSCPDAEAIDVVSDADGAVWALLTLRPPRLQTSAHTCPAPDGPVPDGHDRNAGSLAFVSLAPARFVAGPIDVAGYPVALDAAAAVERAREWVREGLSVYAVDLPKHDNEYTGLRRDYLQRQERALVRATVGHGGPDGWTLAPAVGAHLTSHGEALVAVPVFEDGTGPSFAVTITTAAGWRARDVVP